MELTSPKFSTIFMQSLPIDRQKSLETASISYIGHLCRKSPVLSRALILCFCLALSLTSATGTSFVFNGFDGTNITLKGIAAFDSGLIDLTNDSTRLFGRAFYPYPVNLKKISTNVTSSFSTTFVFSITPMYPTLGGHGMAFLITPSLNSHDAYPSQYLGLLNVSDNGNSSAHLFAVEFDIVQDLEFRDINDNHVGINVDSMTSVNASKAGYWASSTAMVDLNLKSGALMQAWIQHDQQQPAIPLLSVHLDLSTVIEEYMYVGFSGSTGVLSGVHRVHSWSFNSDGMASPLDLSKLPRIPQTSHSRSQGFTIGVTIAVTLLLVLAFATLALTIRQKRSLREVVEDWELEFGLHRYTYKELSVATQGFHDRQLLGRGGFGRVYKGVLRNSGLEVAVKRLSRESDQGQREFIAEIASMGRLRHRNLVQLLGWSRSRRKGELLLVYDYMPNGSLDKALFARSGKLLRWKERYKILSGVAAGMFYLHEGWEQQVLHRDVKASNVLLDADMNARLGDFGLARLYEHGQNPHTTRVVGTLGYLAPEFTKTGKATTSTDVFSFGALLLEVATGRRPLEHHKSEDFILLEGVCDLYSEGRLLEAADLKLDGRFDVEEMERVLLLGLLCSHPNPSIRPTMRQVVQLLATDAPLPPLPPFYPPSGQSSLKVVASEGTSLSSSSQKSWSTPEASTTISAR